MGTFTAHLLVGQSHPNDGGIIGVSHQLYLSENSFPTWSLESVQIRGLQEGPPCKPILWIPTLEYMLEDALLMIAIYVQKDPELLRMANKHGFALGDRVELYQDIPDDQLQLMRERVKQMNHGYKLLLTVHQGSTISGQIERLENYSMDIEVCMPVYVREYNMWSGKQEVRGRLVGTEGW